MRFTVPNFETNGPIRSHAGFRRRDRRGSFVGASDALALSKAAVSRHVADLESHLGVRLIHRTTRKLSLTAEGEVFHARCEELLACVEEAEAEITSVSGEATGILRINVPFTFGHLHLAPLWVEFMALHPKVTLDVTLADRVVDLVEEGFDMAVRIARLPNSTLISRQLTSTRLVLCASPSYLRNHGTPAHPSELAQHAVVAYSLFSMGDNWAFTGPRGMLSVKVSPRLRTNNGDTCRVAALRHQGIVLQPFLPRRPGSDRRNPGRAVAGLPFDRTRRVRGLPLAKVRRAQVFAC